MSLPLKEKGRYSVLQMRPEHFAGVRSLCRLVYPNVNPWREDQLKSHHEIFPLGQLVAVDTRTNRVAGYAASLILKVDDYAFDSDWRRYTNDGLFTNHDARNGDILYGAEVMVDPALQGHGLGSLLYEGRAQLAEHLRLRAIRAGSRLRGYHKFVSVFSPREYVDRVVSGRIWDPTLGFQLRKGFKVLGVASDYLFHDPESLGHAAVVECRVQRPSGVRLIPARNENSLQSLLLQTEEDVHHSQRAQNQ